MSTSQMKVLLWSSNDYQNGMIYRNGTHANTGKAHTCHVDDISYM